MPNYPSVSSIPILLFSCSKLRVLACLYKILNAYNGEGGCIMRNEMGDMALEQRSKTGENWK